MGTLLLRMSEALKHDKKDRAIFLINNYDLILSIVNVCTNLHHTGDLKPQTLPFECGLWKSQKRAHL